MKIILLEDVKNVGKKDQTINASDGYAKNYLIPKKLAVEATEANIRKLDRKKAGEAAKAAEELEKAKKLCEELEERVLEIKVKVGGNGKLFGAVTNKEVSAAIKEQFNLDIDKKKITVEPIKMVGDSEAVIKIHPQVNAKIRISVSQG